MSPPVDVRPPAVAGAFYPSDPAALREAVEASFRDRRGVGRRRSEGHAEPRRTRAVVVPHAGYVYSGAIAARAYDRIARETLPSEILLLGVDHHGGGAPFALSGRPWRTPLGTTTVAEELVDRLRGGPIVLDDRAHLREHSLEVQLPFLQRVAPGVPLAMLQVRYGEFAALRAVAERVRRAVDRRPVLLVASTDFSHYVPAPTAERLDALALAEIGRGDAEGLYEVVAREGISMCGIAPTTVLLEALRPEGLTTVPLGWGHSGEVEPMREVVGYAAAALEQ